MTGPLDAAAIDDAVCALCEDAAFLLLDPLPAADAPAEGPLLAATVAIAGALRGRVTLAAEQPLCRVVASDMLACDPDAVDDASAAATLAELANIAAGVLVGRRTDGHGVCEFAPPTRDTIDAAAWDALAVDPATRAFAADEGHLLLRFRLDSDA